ncbi:MAG TPA: hypothetical protein VGD41_00500, partial [Pyrinomonadaceae bacterium]
MIAVIDGEFEFTFFGPQDYRLALQPAHHVKGRLRLSAQSHLQKVLLNALLDGFAHLACHLKEAIGGTKTFDALVGTFEVVVLNPEADALPRRLESVELGTTQKLLMERGPEAFDFAERLGMMGRGANMNDALLVQLFL